MSLKNDHDPPRSFHLKQMFSKLLCNFEVTAVNFGDVTAGVSPGSEIGLGFYVLCELEYAIGTSPNSFTIFFDIAQVGSIGEEESCIKKHSCLRNNPVLLAVTASLN